MRAARLGQSAIERAPAKARYFSSASFFAMSFLV